jgi:hypothetical protein
MTITTRQQFVTLRNRMYSSLAEMRRQAPHALRVEARSGATDRRTGEQRGTGAHAAKIADIEKDYADVCKVSGLQTPTQDDFDQMAVIFARWHLNA